jgi:hypothetical protein
MRAGTVRNGGDRTDTIVTRRPRDRLGSHFTDPQVAVGRDARLRTRSQPCQGNFSTNSSFSLALAAAQRIFERARSDGTSPIFDTFALIQKRLAATSSGEAARPCFEPAGTE